MNVQIMTTSGEKKKTIDSAIFDLVYSPVIVAQAVRVYLANQRQGTAKVKTRGEVDRTKKKWYKQKHTGNARHGARNAHIFVGGGVSHGPDGMQNWKLSMSKPMRMNALQTALALQAKDGHVSIVEGLDSVLPKTKDVMVVLNNMNMAEKKILIVLDKTLPNLIRASQNVGSVLCSRVDRLNTYEVMSAHAVLMTEEALKALEGKFKTKKKTEVKEEKKAVKKTTTKKVAKKATEVKE
ncbi:50S ribosomal protein L4 [Candidatus Cerribacteria bacterium 'Amazon FNV 2010 28 9']|uniref:Large ribosomal subunit protein uL4 n=1 Tax=Candidatus Cerribacteria bacterium 'Amazon FNV 2010 28 9' TaxID=2081795 RepID=A0A317JNN5_9BACT|nr:MAG: 50S ribosomal protein L4 [Candidatus Cerribacteria bacterium 'Amazon FNV 2010 28 9']